MAVLFATGRAADGPRYRAMTYDWLHAFLINAGYTTLLKEVIHRERPTARTTCRFRRGMPPTPSPWRRSPNGTTAGRPGCPGYTLASLVAVSRLQRNKHYLSDVMAGATLGYIVGRTVVRVNGKPLDTPRAGAHLSLSPVVGRRTRGIAATVTF